MRQALQKRFQLRFQMVHLQFLLQLTAQLKNADGVEVTDYAVDLSQATKDDIQKGVDANTTVTTKGLTFTGTTGSTTVKKLGESVEISGDDNITTEATADKVQIKLKKDITVDSVTAGDTKIDKNGLKRVMLP